MSSTGGAAPSATGPASATPTAAAIDPDDGDGTATNTSGITKPKRPKDLDRTDERGAEAAARYFLALYEYVKATRDVSGWKAMSIEGTCSFCEKVRRQAEDASVDGTRVSGGDVAIHELKVLEQDSLIGGYPVEVRISQQASTVRFADGTVQKIPANKGSWLRVEVLRYKKGWRVIAVAS